MRLNIDRIQVAKSISLPLMANQFVTFAIKWYTPRKGTQEEENDPIVQIGLCTVDNICKKKLFTGNKCHVG